MRDTRVCTVNKRQTAVQRSPRSLKTTLCPRWHSRYSLLQRYSVNRPFYHDHVSHVQHWCLLLFWFNQSIREYESKHNVLTCASTCGGMSANVYMLLSDANLRIAICSHWLQSCARLCHIYAYTWSHIGTECNIFCVHQAYEHCKLKRNWIEQFLSCFFVFRAKILPTPILEGDHLFYRTVYSGWEVVI